MTYNIFDSRYYMSSPNKDFKQTWTITPNEPIELKVSKVIPQIGEVWYYKLRDHLELGCGKVCEITDETVEVGGLQNWSHQMRYRRSDIDFVEKRA